MDRKIETGRIATEWLNGYNGEERESHKEYLLNSKLLFDQLKAMLHTRHAAKTRVALPDYDSPSWSHKEAHRHGYLEAIEEIARLLP